MTAATGQVYVDRQRRDIHFSLGATAQGFGAISWKCFRRWTHASRSPDVGGILECGGKRSTTPLCLAQLRGNRESLDALCARGSHRREKGAVAASLCRRSPKCWLNDSPARRHMGCAFGENEFVRKSGG